MKSKDKSFSISVLAILYIALSYFWRKYAIYSNLPYSLGFNIIYLTVMTWLAILSISIIFKKLKNDDLCVNPAPGVKE
jgi:ABC-type thiamin/hydroxymethylpyrimidine transport system permease subunit